MKSKFLFLLLYGWLAILIILIGSILIVPRYLWNSMEETPLSLWIVDKTVAQGNYKEHEGLMWALNSLKVVSVDTGRSLSYDKDYYGVHPAAGNEFYIEALPGLADSRQNYTAPDLIYLADVYGVYAPDPITEENWVPVPPRLYGGLPDEELEHIASNLKGCNTIIGEYAFTDASSQASLDELFSVSRLGTSGRYFNELSRYGEVPLRIIKNYEMQTAAPWSFQGAGIILISEDDKITVLQKGKDFKGKGLEFVFSPAYKDELAGEKNAVFSHWFEFTSANPTTEILASYSLDLTQAGMELFAQLGLPLEFPAVVRWKNAQYTSYYFAGDFAERSMGGEYPSHYGYAKIRRLFSFSSEADNTQFFQNAYLPIMEKVIDDIRKTKSEQAGQPVPAPLQLLSRTQEKKFQVMVQGQWVDFFAKGVNIGSSVPGKWFTEFVNDEAFYLEWFEQIAAMHANSIRVYTLLAPEFYSALGYFNQLNPDRPLWLYQEIWPEENPENGNYLGQAYDEAYKEEIRNVIDAMHGQAKIPQRSFRAYGIYARDVSAYIAGYLVGRELEPEEVIRTNQQNPAYAFRGDYFFSEAQASPAEAWLAMCCDDVMQYETEFYGWQHPVGIVSWPTLDPKEHDSEWNISGDKSLEYNDKAEIDINHIGVTQALEAGFFGAYHIYPNYPDFMNNEAAYALYSDEEGTFRYGGYLKEFMEGHQKYPALVGELGLATGMGNAHENPDGYNHGGMTEEQQGLGIVRMMKAIEKEGYAGGLIFEWSDEWAKKTWTTEPYMVPFERNPLWHNAVDPEQNYGIIAMEASVKKAKPFTLAGTGVLKEAELTADEAYLAIRLNLSRAITFDSEDLIIGLDTYARDRGERKYSPEISVQAPTGMEFVVKLAEPKDASLLVIPSYNVAAGKQSSVPSESGSFERMSVLINKERITKDGTRIAPIYYDQSKMHAGSLEENSYYGWNIQGDSLSIRIPWTRLNFSDPSQRRVLEDSRVVAVPLQDELGTVLSEGIVISAVLVKQSSGEVISQLGIEDFSDASAFAWESWDVPEYVQRAKSGYLILSDYFRMP